MHGQQNKKKGTCVEKVRTCNTHERQQTSLGSHFHLEYENRTKRVTKDKRIRKK